MPLYIDADKLWNDRPQVTPEKSMDYKAGFSECMWAFSKLIREQIDNSTADVIPKSEVERLQEEANRYKRYFFRHDYDEMIAEVLDKLDRFINSNCIEIKDERGIKGYVTSGVHFAIAEFKKKYTEGEK